jgi:hypothetical protein
MMLFSVGVTSRLHSLTSAEGGLVFISAGGGGRKKQTGQQLPPRKKLTTDH